MPDYMQYADSLAWSDRAERVARQLKCSVNDALNYLEFRDEGYSQYQSKLMAGISDPEE